MSNGVIEEAVIVHPMGGMQLSQGYIRDVGERRYCGILPGMAPAEGDTLDDVLECLERRAKAYYGEDVIVEISHRICMA